MRAVAARKRKDVVKTPRRRRRISPWKVAVWAAILAPWAIVASVFAGVAWLIWSEGGPDSFAERAKSELMLASLGMGFEIQEVWVDGLERSTPDAVRDAVGAVRGEPILEFDAAAARAKLLTLPWVDDAIVARALPRRIDVKLIERQPLALWQMNKRLEVIDGKGVVIPGVNPANFGHLPVLVGKGANDEAAKLMGLVSQSPGIAGRMTAAVFVAERRWDLRIDDRIDIRLPAEDTPAALVRLAELEQEHGLFGRDIVAIDLRLGDRLVVKLAPGAARAITVNDDGRQG